MSWVKATAGAFPSHRYSLAPQWYADAKAKGATPQELYEIVRDFCSRTLKDPVDDALVELMIDTYEAG